MVKKILFFFIFALFINQSHAEENLMILKLKGKIDKFVTSSTKRALKEKYD